MKRFFAFFVAAFLMMHLTSCDWVRSRLGMPTSEDLQWIREQRHQDSVNKAALEKQALEQAQALAKAQQDSIQAVAQTHVKRYHVVPGSYKQEANVAKMIQVLSDLHYSPIRLSFKSGYTGVSAYQTDTLARAYEQVKALTQAQVTKDDIWIYDTQQNLLK